MKFGPVDTVAAAGAILAHTLRTDAAVFKKGRQLSAGDCAALAAAGYDQLVVARLDPDDTHEDAAAVAVAAASAGDGVRVAEPFTGRSNVYATERGLAVIRRERIDATNAVDDSVTIATLAPFALVSPGEMVATVKIIPFGVPGSVVAACTDAVAGAVAVAPLRPLTIGLILTELPGVKTAVLDRAATNMRTRATQLGSEVVAERRCHHDEAAVAATIAELRGLGCSLIAIVGASAVVDRDDVVPRAVRRDGGTIERFGMPVDPGNLLVLARRGDCTVIGVPGCARSLKPSGFDWVLQRLCAGIMPSHADIAAMGTGGLLADIAGRPQPRRAATRGRAPHQVAAVILAAGQSRRMGPTNKLLADVDGRPMVAHVVDAALASAAAPVVVVTGFEAERVRAALADRPVVFVDNPDYAAGMSTSVRAGIRALSNVDGALICLGDMPWIRPEHMDALIEALEPVEGREICVPLHAGKRGNPVLFSSRLFSAMTGLSGDVGARQLIADNQDLVCELEVADTGVLVDVDTREALAARAPAAKD